jgi:hypothetical protein
LPLVAELADAADLPRIGDAAGGQPGACWASSAAKRTKARRPVTRYCPTAPWSAGRPAICTPGVRGNRTYTCRYLVNGTECGLVLNFPPCRDPNAGPASWK